MEYGHLFIGKRVLKLHVVTCERSRWAWNNVARVYVSSERTRSSRLWRTFCFSLVSELRYVVQRMEIKGSIVLKNISQEFL